MPTLPNNQDFNNLLNDQIRDLNVTYYIGTLNQKTALFKVNVYVRCIYIQSINNTIYNNIQLYTIIYKVKSIFIIKKLGKNKM